MTFLNQLTFAHVGHDLCLSAVLCSDFEVSFWWCNHLVAVWSWIAGRYLEIDPLTWADCHQGYRHVNLYLALISARPQYWLVVWAVHYLTPSPIENTMRPVSLRQRLVMPDWLRCMCQVLIMRTHIFTHHSLAWHSIHVCNHTITLATMAVESRKFIRFMAKMRKNTMVLFLWPYIYLRRVLTTRIEDDAIRLRTFSWLIKLS